MTKQFEYAINQIKKLICNLDACEVNAKAELQSAIKTLQEDKGEVIAEGVVRLECPTVGIGNSNIPSLNWFEIIKDYVGKQVKLILIKKGE